MIVTSSWLQDQFVNLNIRIVDVRGKVQDTQPRYVPLPEEYEAGHIPGAVFVDWTRDIVDLDDPVPVNVAGPEKFRTLMESLGIGDETFVVTYDDHNSMFAGRLAWALRYYGHDKVAVLDGGFKNWKLEGRMIETNVPAQTFPSAKFTPKIRKELRKTADEVQERSSDVLLIDGRKPEVYAKGFIPGAHNVPHPNLIDPVTGKFLPGEELKRAFQVAGIDVEHLPEKIIVYCNGGVSATVPLTALEILGKSDVSLYDGSWNEWGKDPLRAKKEI
ncbi:hypothetical protein A0128_04110 [Leptospira tipperaryensis]|uniref:Sulfurtransferase n=1 Tax=Leptospira tipperaryensis TaxID=2564040 RepID=A0A1D7UU89_9LEPT|nr:sulfurtransferase [Leptospira tipperaryensis]AOP33113.1 hypothetical protein A0128_04110 [Leptospira tipperaryensis]